MFSIKRTLNRFTTNHTETIGKKQAKSEQMFPLIYLLPTDDTIGQNPLTHFADEPNYVT